jgi:hypothetical protein
MQYIFYYPDWQLVSDHANFCLETGRLILGISGAISKPGVRCDHLSAQRQPITWKQARAAPNRAT